MIGLYGESFSKAACAAILGMCREEFKCTNETLISKGVSREGSDIVIALPFYGSVKGHYLLVISKECGEFLTAKVDTGSVQDLKHSVLCEILNTAVGEAIVPLIQNYKDIKIFSPIISSCPIEYPEVDSVRMTIKNTEGMSIELYTMVEPQNTSPKVEEIQDVVKRVYDAAEIKSQYLEVMAHELKNPLNSVLGFTDLLLEEDLSEEQLQMINSLRSSSESINNIVSLILEYMSLGNEDSSVDESQFNLENMIADLTNKVKNDYRNKAIEIKVKLNKTVPHLIADSVKLEKALSLLIDNAVKFTEKGEVLIEVNPSLANGENLELEFKVKDTGIGIDQSEIAKILEPFERGDTSITREHRGLGLGLPICERLVSNMGGTLSIDSQLEKGTSVSFKLKVKLAPDSEATSPYFKGKRAIVLSSHRDQTLINSLKHYGLQVDYFESLVSFFKQNRQKFDILFLKLDYEETMQATQIFLRNKIEEKVVNIVGASDIKLKNELIKLGAQHFLSQPFNANETLDVSKRVLDFSEKSESLQNIKSAKLKVLIAEDDFVNQMVIKKVFVLIGCEIDIACDGLQALQKLEKHKYDIVFMDLQMPKVDGLTATKKIRQIEKFNNMPIIALTASDGGDIRQSCKDVGMKGFISKPFNLDKIKKVLNLCIKFLNEKHEKRSFALID